jgi:hypothetical protein
VERVGELEGSGRFTLLDLQVTVLCLAIGLGVTMSGTTEVPPFSPARALAGALGLAAGVVLAGPPLAWLRLRRERGARLTYGELLWTAEGAVLWVMLGLGGLTTLQEPGPWPWGDTPRVLDVLFVAALLLVWFPLQVGVVVVLPRIRDDERIDPDHRTTPRGRHRLGLAISLTVALGHFGLLLLGMGLLLKLSS